MAKAREKAAAAPRRSWFWLQGVICGGAAAMLPGPAVMLLVLLAPGLAMYAAERVRGRPLARAMILMGAASALTPLHMLWDQGGSLDAALTIMGDPARPLFSWVAAGAGWFAGQVTEVATRFTMNARAAQGQRRLVQEREALIAEWVEVRRR